MIFNYIVITNDVIKYHYDTLKICALITALTSISSILLFFLNNLYIYIMS